MSKEFIPYEDNIVLIELGLNIGTECIHHYYDEDKYLFPVREMDDIEGGWVPAVTFSQAFGWFRNKHNLIFQIKYLFNGNYAVVIHKNTHEYIHTIQDLTHACVDEIPDNYSYEEAELECLRKLIEIVKEK
jgi:hypothetical protein